MSYPGEAVTLMATEMQLECQETKNSEQINLENKLFFFFFFRSPVITHNSRVICKGQRAEQHRDA